MSGPLRRGATGPEDDYRLGARRGTQRRQKHSGITQHPYIENDAVGFRVGECEFEDLAEIDVTCGTEHRHRGEADADAVSVVEQCAGYRARL